MMPFFMGKGAEPAAPVLGTPTVNNQFSGALCTGGGCTVKTGTNDTIQVAWSISGANDAYFQTKVYRDGGLKQTGLSSATGYSEFAPGSVGWNGGSTPVSFTFRVDVVSINTGAVVASATAAVFNNTYFTTCPGPC